MERGRRPRPVFCRVSRVERVIIVIAPFVGVCGTADERVLVEGEQVFVFEDREVFFLDCVQLDPNTSSVSII